MEIWLKGSKNLRIPVLPASYQVSSSQKDTTVDINAVGEVDLGGKDCLRTISFSSFFPKQYDPDYCETRNIRSPSSYVQLVEKLKRAGTVRLLMTGTPIRMRCRIVSFDWSEDDGTGNINYTISLKEHRNISIGTSTVVTLAEAQGATGENSGETIALDGITSATARTEPDRNTNATYVVKAGDSLASIARKLTGSADESAIYQQNKEAIGSNPNSITAGMSLIISNARALS